VCVTPWAACDAPWRTVFTVCATVPLGGGLGAGCGVGAGLGEGAGLGLGAGDGDGLGAGEDPGPGPPPLEAVTRPPAAEEPPDVEDARTE
jgi:hypothetical protein